MNRNKGRPDPVSCQSCRTKKLKCNRVQPCSNCSARGISCAFRVPPQKQAATIATNAEILGRIERLESVVLPSVVTSHSEFAVDDSHLTRLAANPSPYGAAASPVYQKRDEDSQVLENIGTREDSLVRTEPLACAKFIFIQWISNVVHEMLESQIPLQHSTSMSDGPLSIMTVILPVYEIANLLFQSYESKVDHMCRIMHIPTVRSLVKIFYLRINQKDPLSLGQAALLLSIFAISAFFYQPFDTSKVASTEQDAIQLSKILGKGALDVLDHSRRNTSGALEDIQASIIMSLLIQHLDGFSARGRLLLASATSIARDLRLQRLDADSKLLAENQLTGRVLIDYEVKRRVFWYITSSDWLLASTSGPQEGTYFIHPNHINVRLPKDCSDDEIALGEDNEPTAGSRPTSMTFFLEKVRLAHLCRELADTVPLEISNLMQMPYEHIIALDHKLEEFISSLPFYFRLDTDSRQKSRTLETIYPMIPVWRYCIATAAHSRRFKLHQRFLLRQAWDPRYAYSRKACLESARAVIQVYEDIAGFYSPSTLMVRMGMAVHFTHLALVVMVMDICFNKDEANEVEIRAHVKKALQIFEDAKDISPLLARFLHSLSSILQKHQVYLSDATTSVTEVVAGSDDKLESVKLGDIQDSGVTLDTSLDDFWQVAFESEYEPNLDSLTWDNLFSALDRQPM